MPIFRWGQPWDPLQNLEREVDRLLQGFGGPALRIEMPMAVGPPAISSPMGAPPCGNRPMPPHGISPKPSPTPLIK